MKGEEEKMKEKSKDNPDAVLVLPIAWAGLFLLGLLMVCFLAPIVGFPVCLILIVITTGIVLAIAFWIYYRSNPSLINRERT
jgi:hypothetical protein